MPISPPQKKEPLSIDSLREHAHQPLADGLDKLLSLGEGFLNYAGRSLSALVYGSSEKDAKNSFQKDQPLPPLPSQIFQEASALNPPITQKLENNHSIKIITPSSTAIECASIKSLALRTIASASLGGVLMGPMGIILGASISLAMLRLEHVLPQNKHEILPKLLIQLFYLLVLLGNDIEELSTDYQSSNYGDMTLKIFSFLSSNLLLQNLLHDGLKKTMILSGHSHPSSHTPPKYHFEAQAFLTGIIDQISSFSSPLLRNALLQNFTQIFPFGMAFAQGTSAITETPTPDPEFCCITDTDPTSTSLPTANMIAIVLASAFGGLGIIIGIGVVAFLCCCILGQSIPEIIRANRYYRSHRDLPNRNNDLNSLDLAEQGKSDETSDNKDLSTKPNHYGTFFKQNPDNTESVVLSGNILTVIHKKKSYTFKIPNMNPSTTEVEKIFSDLIKALEPHEKKSYLKKLETETRAHKLSSSRLIEKIREMLSTR